MPHKDGGWQVKRDSGKRASRRAVTKEDAERLAREISGNQETELIVARQAVRSNAAIAMATTRTAAADVWRKCRIEPRA